MKNIKLSAARTLIALSDFVQAQVIMRLLSALDRLGLKLSDMNTRLELYEAKLLRKFGE